MFDTKILADRDKDIMAAFVGSCYTKPDLVIAPDGDPYLYRWHIVKSDDYGCAYFHIQVASDPERPLHDHPWDNCSLILSGGYSEVIQQTPPLGVVTTYTRVKGDLIYRKATEAHRLILPRYVPYTMTLFTAGPKKRTWGFWIGTKWVPYTEVTEVLEDGRSIWTGPHTGGADE